MVQRRTPGGRGPARPSGPRGSAKAGGKAGAAGSGPTAPAAREAPSRPAPTSRDAAARRSGAKRTAAPQPRKLTGRAAVLGLVLVCLLLAYAYPIRVYLSQQAEIARLERAQALKRARIAELTEERAKWDDPEYVKYQARSRFLLVERGDKTYIVIFDPPGAARDAGLDPASTKGVDKTPWYGKLWSSIGAANEPPHDK
ncbi:MAG TPA: septum formation initiator family protein [Micromonosporaceae bacterium]|nr:septum formation initiator family protein [Micromonosporaceae bacterium]